MEANQSTPSDHPHAAEDNDVGSMSSDHAHVPTISSSNSNVNIMHGSGSIINYSQITNRIDVRHPAPPEQHKSDMSITKTLPARPTVFHGREDYLENAVRLLTASYTARVAITGPGGMGKTTVAYAILHDERIVTHYDGQRYFLPCGALVSADALVVALARLFGIPASGDLLSAVVNHLMSIPGVLLVFDNLETPWLVGGGPVAAVDDLLGRLAQIPSLSLIITCRGTDLPQSVKWSNGASAALEPFSLDAALQTFQDRAQRRLTETGQKLAKQLLEAVDRMPLAVSLLGQLVRNGRTVSYLLDRWNREHTGLLQTYGTDRANSVKLSIEISIDMLCQSDDSQESLQLLSVCSMLPDGLRLDVFEALRPQFKHIDRACDTLTLYALAKIDADRTLKVLSPIRHLVMDQYPLPPNLRDALCSIYFAMAERLPMSMDEQYKKLSEAFTPETGNLSSLLLMLVKEPSENVVDAVFNFTRFMYFQRPNTTLASALLAHAEEHPRWKATCLFLIGDTQYMLDEYRSAIGSLTTAAQIFDEIGDRQYASVCNRLAGESYRAVGEYDNAHTLLQKAMMVFLELKVVQNIAECGMSLGSLMQELRTYDRAIKYFQWSREGFASCNQSFNVSQCTMFLGNVYLEQRDVSTAVAELEAARTAFRALGAPIMLAQSTRLLAGAYRLRRNFALAEELLLEAVTLFKDCGDRNGLAGSAFAIGCLFRDQERWEEARGHYKFALQLYESLEAKQGALKCRVQLTELEAPTHLSATTDTP